MKNSRLRQNEKGIWRNQKIFIKPGQKNSGKNRKEVMQTTAQWSEVYAVLTDGKNIQAGRSKKVNSP